MLLRMSSEVIKEPPFWVALTIIYSVFIVLVYRFYYYALTKHFSEKRKLNHIRGKCFYLFLGKVSLGETICFLPNDFLERKIEGEDILLMLFTVGLLTSETLYITLPEEWCWPIDYNKEFKMGDRVAFNLSNGLGLQEGTIVGIRNDKAVIVYNSDNFLEQKKIALIKLIRLT